MRRRHIYLLILAFVLASCTKTPKDVKVIGAMPPIYPDYKEVTIPQNIAPLNFLVRGTVEAVEAVATCGERKITVNSNGNQVCFDLDNWKAFIESSAGKQIRIQVSALINGQWLQYKPFHWQVVEDKVDPYLTYRLIEPDYEIYNNLQLQERCVESFDERAICDHNMVGNRCMNCHIYGNQNPELSMMYVRGKGGGAVFSRNGHLRKLNIKTADMVSPSVYAGFNRLGRFLVFSSNIIIPAFHSLGSKRLEVYDSKSDVYVADLDNNRILHSPLLSDSLVLETFPAFSPDGKYIYFCTAPRLKLPEELKRLRYSLCRIAFDDRKGTFGNRVDTIYNARIHGKSVCHPRLSPDGKYLLYTLADYGTFPIWHREADLQVMNTKTGKMDNLAVVNSNRSDTYHSWSSNSRWFVFVSKRDDGLYGKPYFCYIDCNGHAHKPFVLPQEHPDFYDNNLKSFNIPELGKGKLPFGVVDVEKVMKKQAEDFVYN